MNPMHRTTAASVVWAVWKKSKIAPSTHWQTKANKLRQARHASSGHREVC